MVPPLQQRLLVKDAGESAAAAPYRVPFKNLFCKSFEQKGNVVEKMERNKFSDVRPSRQVFERVNGFEIEKLNISANGANKKTSENVEKMLPCIVRQEILQEKRMKYGNMSDAWSFKNDSNNIILDNTESVGEKILSSGKGRISHPRGWKLNPLELWKLGKILYYRTKRFYPQLLYWMLIVLIWN